MILIITCLCVLLAATTRAHAYVDPGTGSYLIQTLAASVLAGVFVIKCFWKSIKEKISGIFGGRR